MVIIACRSCRKRITLDTKDDALQHCPNCGAKTRWKEESFWRPVPVPKAGDVLHLTGRHDPLVVGHTTSSCNIETEL